MKQKMLKFVCAAVLAGLILAGQANAQNATQGSDLLARIEAQIAAIKQTIADLKARLFSGIISNSDVQLKYKSIDGKIIEVPGPNPNEETSTLMDSALAAAASIKRSCVQYSPIIEISSGQQGKSGQTLNYAATIINTNRRCPDATYNVSLTAPENWTLVSDKTAVTIASGQSQTINLQLTSPADAADGWNKFYVAATDNDYPIYTTKQTGLAVIFNSADTVPPTVYMSSPIDGGIYTWQKGGVIYIIGNQNDNVGLAKEEILVNDKVISTMGFGTIWFQYFWQPARGAYKVQIAVYDLAGNKTMSQPANIVVQ